MEQPSDEQLEELTQYELMDLLRLAKEKAIMDVEERPPGATASNADLLGVLKICSQLQDGMMMMMSAFEDMNDHIAIAFEELMEELSPAMEAMVRMLRAKRGKR